MIYQGGAGGNFLRWLMLRDDKNYELSNNEWILRVSEFSYPHQGTHEITICHNLEEDLVRCDPEARIVNLFCDDQKVSAEVQMIWGIKNVLNPQARPRTPCPYQGSMDILRAEWDHYIRGELEPNSDDFMWFPETEYTVDYIKLMREQSDAEMLKLYSYMDLEPVDIDHDMHLLKEYNDKNMRLIDKYIWNKQ